MKRLLAALFLVLSPLVALAQPINVITPRTTDYIKIESPRFVYDSFAPISALATLIGNAPCGTVGQIQFNNGGVCGSFTLGGDATLNTGTGALTINNGAITAGKMANGAAVLNIGFTPISIATLGIANGVATLDASGFVPIAQLPPAITGGLAFQGNWNANTNSPTLVSSTGTVGQYYFVSTAGSTTLNGTSSWSVGDLVLFSSGVWNKIPGGGGGGGSGVSSVAGLTGAVTGGSLVGAIAANPSASIGLTATNGSATTVMRSDSAPPLSQAIVPTWTGIHTFSARPVFNAGASIASGPLLLAASAGGGPAGAQLNSVFTAASNVPAWGFQETEALATGAAFHLPFVIQHLANGSGNRQTFTALLTATASNNGDQLPAGNFQAVITSGSGSVFGSNSVAVVCGTAAVAGQCPGGAGASAAAEAVGAEINTTVRRNIARKAGLNIVDAGGTGIGTSLDYGILIATGAGGSGYQTGIQFDGGGATSGVKSGGNLMVGPTATVSVGLEFSATTFSSFAMRSPGFDVTGSGQVDAAALNVSGTITLDGNALSGAATSAAVTVTCGTGTITTGTLSGTAHYKRLADRTVLINVDVAVSNPFTGSCAFPTFTLPASMTAASAATFMGRETAGAAGVAGQGVAGTLAASGSGVSLSKISDNSNPIAAGAAFTVGSNVFVN